MSAYAALLQAVIGVLAFFVAPGALYKAYETLTRRIHVICEPRLRTAPRPLRAESPVELLRRLRAAPTASIGANYARVWDLEFSNRSSRMFGLQVYILGATQPNSVRAVRVRNPTDGGLQVKYDLQGGLLTLLAERFHKSRKLIVSVVLERPDRPIFLSNVGEVLTRYRLKEQTIGAGFQYLFVQHQRLMLFLLGYAAAIALIMIRLLWLAAQ